MPAARHPKERQGAGPEAGVGRRGDLDGLRGVAVLLVLVLHYVRRSGYFPLGPEPVAQLLDASWAGVDVFFVLSGFLIGGIILDQGRAPHFFRVFYLRRALRILPVAWLVLAGVYFGLGHVWPAQLSRATVPWWSYLLFVNNWWTATGHRIFGPLGPLWSLAVEEQFYLVAPWLLLLVRPPARTALLLTVVLFSPLARLQDWGLSPWDCTLFRLDGFAVGILLASGMRRADLPAWAARNGGHLVSACLALVVAALAFAAAPGIPAVQRVAWGISLYSLAAGAVILVTQVLAGPGAWGRPAAGDWAARVARALSAGLSFVGLRLLGRYSYFLYLWHMPVLWAVAAVVKDGPWRAGLSAVLCLGLAALSWHGLEGPLTRWGRRWRYG